MDIQQTEETNLIRHIFNWIVDIAVVISLAWFCVYAFGTQIHISGHSMTPVLESEETVLVNRLAYDLTGPGRFDIVTFEREDKKTNVKRVIGLPGETVQIRDGFVYINKQKLEADDGLDQAALPGLAETEITLGKREYFLLGDNRESSEDSRFENIGNVSRAQITGRVWFRIAPLSGLGFIK